MTSHDEARRDALVGRLNTAILGLADLFTLYLGDRLGLYQHLAESGPSTAAELATRAGIHPRYAREWLEQQAVAGVVELDDASLPPDGRRYVLPAAHAPVVADPADPVVVVVIVRVRFDLAGFAPERDCTNRHEGQQDDPAGEHVQEELVGED